MRGVAVMRRHACVSTQQNLSPICVCGFPIRRVSRNYIHAFARKINCIEPSSRTAAGNGVLQGGPSIFRMVETSLRRIGNVRRLGVQKCVCEVLADMSLDLNNALAVLVIVFQKWNEVASFLNEKL